jgi:hypothetical protein
MFNYLCKQLFSLLSFLDGAATNLLEKIELGVVFRHEEAKYGSSDEFLGNSKRV